MPPVVDRPDEPPEADGASAEGSTGDHLRCVVRGPWTRVRRAALRFVVATLSAAFVYYGFSFWQVWSTGRIDQVRSVDVIVVLGAAQYDGRPSPQLAARLDHVVELWSLEAAPLVVVAGGKQQGDRFTEAEASERYLTDRGIPASAIVQEATGSNTFESLDRARRLVASDVETALIVTDPYHALRSRLIADEVGFDARVSSAPDSVVTGAAELRRQLAEAAAVAIGRIIGFERLSVLTD